LIVHDQRNLGAAQNYGIATRRFHPANDALEGDDRFGLKMP